MKIGAGHRLQAYDQHGRYTGPRGGAMPIGGGPVRLFGAEGLAEPGGGETPEPSAEGLETVAKTLEQAREQAEQAAQKAAEQAAEEARQAAEEMARAAQEAAKAAEVSSEPLKGVLLADSGQTRTDAGGGWDNEARRLEEKKYSPERLVQRARADLGSDKWKPVETDGQTRNQCNVFVAEKLRESGAHVPNVGGVTGKVSPEMSDALREASGGKWGGNPPSASDWHKGKVPGFERVKTENGEKPMPGDVASNGKHVGLVSGEGKTISVTTADRNAPDYGYVVENAWGFRPGQQDSVTFWRVLSK